MPDGGKPAIKKPTLDPLKHSAPINRLFNPGFMTIVSWLEGDFDFGREPRRVLYSADIPNEMRAKCDQTKLFCDVGRIEIAIGRQTLSASSACLYAAGCNKIFGEEKHTSKPFQQQVVPIDLNSEFTPSFEGDFDSGPLGYSPLAMSCAVRSCSLQTREGPTNSAGKAKAKALSTIRASRNYFSYSSCSCSRFTA